MHVDLTQHFGVRGIPVDFGGRDNDPLPVDALDEAADHRAADAALSLTRARAAALSQTRARAAASVNKMSGELADPLKRWPQIEQETWLQRQLLAENAHHMDGAWTSAPSEATLLEHVLALQEQMRELQKQLPRKPGQAPEVRGHLDPQTPALPVALLRQLKVLLDDGSITPEQFELKREELLARSTGAAEDRARSKRLSSSHAENVQSTYSIAIGALSSDGCPLVVRVTTAPLGHVCPARVGFWLRRPSRPDWTGARRPGSCGSGQRVRGAACARDQRPDHLAFEPEHAVNNRPHPPCALQPRLHIPLCSHPPSERTSATSRRAPA